MAPLAVIAMAFAPAATPVAIHAWIHPAVTLPDVTPLVSMNPSDVIALPAQVADIV